MKRVPKLHIDANKIGDDSWLANVQDVITKPTHRINLFVNNEHNNVTVKIEYDDLKSVESIVDDYGNYQKVRAFYESLTAFIDELPSGIKLEVNQTNIFYLFNEVLTEERPNARRVRTLLKSRDIELILTAKKSKTNRKGRR